MSPIEGMSASLPETFTKSTLSGDGACVEVAFPASGGAVVRDSKDPQGPVLTFTTREWTAFLGGVHAGEFEPPPPKA
jgi:hypothetical protein